MTGSVNFGKIATTGSFKSRNERHANDKRKTYETTSASRSKKSDVLEVIESGLEVEEVRAVDVVQEVLEITVDSGAATSVW